MFFTTMFNVCKNREEPLGALSSSESSCNLFWLEHFPALFLVTKTPLLDLSRSDNNFWFYLLIMFSILFITRRIIIIINQLKISLLEILLKIFLVEFFSCLFLDHNNTPPTLDCVTNSLSAAVVVLDDDKNHLRIFFFSFSLKKRLVYEEKNIIFGPPSSSPSPPLHNPFLCSTFYLDWLRHSLSILFIVVWSSPRLCYFLRLRQLHSSRSPTAETPRIRVDGERISKIPLWLWQRCPSTSTPPTTTPPGPQSSTSSWDSTVSPQFLLFFPILLLLSFTNTEAGFNGDWPWTKL